MSIECAYVSRVVLLNHLTDPLVCVSTAALIYADHFVGRLFGNTLCLIGSTYYVYITFLGYASIPNLKNTRYILYAIVPIFLFYLIALIAGMNLCRMIIDFYHYRVY